MRRALRIFDDPNASRQDLFWAQNKLLDAGVRGPWQGGESVEQVRHRHPTDPDAYWDPTAGKAHEGRWRNWKSGRIVAGDPPEGVRTKVGAEADTKASLELRKILEVGPGPVSSDHLELMKMYGEQTMLQALHKAYPKAQLGAVDIRGDIIKRVDTHFVREGLLPENTFLRQASYTDPDIVKEFGRADLVVNVAPSPQLIQDAGGAAGYVKTLLDLTEPGGKIYVAVDPTTLDAFDTELEVAFRELTGAKPIYHWGGSLSESHHLPLDDVYSVWIRNLRSTEKWVEYLAIRR